MIGFDIVQIRSRKIFILTPWVTNVVKLSKENHLLCIFGIIYC